MVKKYASEYAYENSILYFGDYCIQARPGTEKKCLRLTVAGGGKYDENREWQPTSFHLEYDELWRQNKALYPRWQRLWIPPYEVSYNNTKMYAEAAELFDRIEIWFSKYAIETGTGKIIYPENLDENGEEIE